MGERNERRDHAYGNYLHLTVESIREQRFMFAIMILFNSAAVLGMTLFVLGYESLSVERGVVSILLPLFLITICVIWSSQEGGAQKLRRAREQVFRDMEKSAIPFEDSMKKSLELKLELEIETRNLRNRTQNSPNENELLSDKIDDLRLRLVEEHEYEAQDGNRKRAEFPAPGDIRPYQREWLIVGGVYPDSGQADKSNLFWDRFSKKAYPTVFVVVHLVFLGCGVYRLQEQFLYF